MKMCPYCGNKIKGNLSKCSHCSRKFSATDKQIKFTFLKVIFLCVVVFLIIFIPAYFIMLNQYPLMKSKPNICRKECGWFSYDYADGKTYCVCKNNDVYNTYTNKHMYSGEDVLNQLLNLNNLDSFYSKFENDEDILLIVKNNDLKNVKKLNNILIRLALEYKNTYFYKTDFYYIDLDILKSEEISRLNQVVGEDLESENIFAIGIKDGSVVYKEGKSSSFKYDDLYNIIFDYVKG